MILKYKNLPITIYGEEIDSDYYQPPHYETKERIVDYDFEIDKEKVVDILADMITDEELPEVLDDKEIYSYISEHFDNIFNKHKEEVLNYLESKAIEAAEKYYNEQEAWGDYDESLKENKMELTERKWNYTIEAETARKFRNAIEAGDLYDVQSSIIDIYEEIFNKGFIDEDDYNEYVEEVTDINVDEDEIDFQLGELYDLCDNLGVFIPTNLDEEVRRGDPEYLRAIDYLDKNPDAYAYVCSARINGKEFPIGAGVQSAEEYQEVIDKFYDDVKEKLGNEFEIERINTIYQGDKESHRQALHDFDEQLEKTVDETEREEIKAEIAEKEAELDFAEDHNNFWKATNIQQDLDELNEDVDDVEDDDKLRINIEVIVANDVDEDIVSGNVEDKYDDQTLEEWYDFASNIEGIVDRKFIVKNINLSKNIESLSEYIDFYCKDADGNKKEGMIDLRLSDHRSTSNARRLRKKKANNLDPNNKLISVIVNERQFDSYDSALKYVETLLDRLNESLNEATLKQGNTWVNKGKEGTHGKFRTKKEADAQRKAMFAQGFKEDLDDDFDLEVEDEDALTDYEKELCNYMLDNCREDYEDSDDLLGKMDVYYSEYNSLAKRKRDQVRKYFDEHIKTLDENIQKDEECCICGEPIKGYGNNPAPVKDAGVCCDKCNRDVVIPARLKNISKNKLEEKVSSKIEDKEETVRYLLDQLHKALEDGSIQEKVYKDTLDKAIYELDNIRIPGIKEDLTDKYKDIEPDSDDIDFIEYAEENPADEKDNLFDSDDNFDLDIDKLAEAMKNFQPQAPIMNESIPQPNQITEEKKVENPGTEEEPITVDPKTVDDDVDDIDLM